MVHRPSRSVPTGSEPRGRKAVPERCRSRPLAEAPRTQQLLTATDPVPTSLLPLPRSPRAPRPTRSQLLAAVIDVLGRSVESGSWDRPQGTPRGLVTAAVARLILAIPDAPVGFLGSEMAAAMGPVLTLEVAEVRLGQC